MKSGKIFQFITIPAPIGLAGALIFAAGYALKQWDPIRYPDFKTIFTTLPWMTLLAAFIGFAVILYYIFRAFLIARLFVIRTLIKLRSRGKITPENMVFVPSGKFIFRKNEKRNLESFFIDKFPVTNREYSRFIKATGHMQPEGWIDGKCHEGKGQHPVTNVCWSDVQAYITWRSKKDNREYFLPREDQWEKAARGPLGLTYPWGNKFDGQRCNAAKGHSGITTPVDSFPSGKSIYGCLDMVGNVWEWTRDFYDEENDVMIIKGGSYYFEEEFTMTHLRYHDPKSSKYWDLGFRCVCFAS